MRIPKMCTRVQNHVIVHSVLVQNLQARKRVLPEVPTKDPVWNEQFYGHVEMPRGICKNQLIRDVLGLRLNVLILRLRIGRTRCKDWNNFTTKVLGSFILYNFW